MTGKHQQTWISFHDFFAKAEARGINCVEAAEALLRNIRVPAAAGKVKGLRRHWEYLTPSMADERARIAAQMRWMELVEQLENESTLSEDQRLQIIEELERLKPEAAEHDGWREMARDPLKRCVPVTVWCCFDRVESDCNSHWIDDQDDPEEAACVDWVSGTAEFHMLDERTRYLSLEVDAQLAELILGNTAGVVIDRADSASRPKLRPAQLSISQRSLPLPAAKYIEWWNGLSDEQRALGQREHVALCEKAFPKHKISRDCVRGLTKGRRRPGPPPKLTVTA